jgi:hypothetical protein
MAIARLPCPVAPCPNRARQKITLGKMRASGVRGALIYCADYQCSHYIRINADQ